MAITREKKGMILEKVGAIAKAAKTIVFVRFRGLPVSETNAMRRDLRGSGVGYTVAKKTLVRKALGDAGVAGEMPVLDGEVALAYLGEGEGDVLVPARTVYEYVKKFKENLAIVGGVFGGRFVGRDEMVGIATIPPLPMLRGQFVNLINSPIQGFVMALSEVAKKRGTGN